MSALTRLRLLCLALVMVMGGGARAGDSQPPNIVILFADDLGYADLGSYGNPYIRTPNLDEMARQGQRWTDFYVAAPVCSPSRGALMTGELPVRSGLYGRRLNVMHPGDEHGIPRELTTLPAALKSAGYATGIFGKWHLGDAPDNYPTRRGFDYWYGVPYSNDMDRVGAPSIDEILRMVANGRGGEARASYMETVRLFDDPKSEYWNIPLYRSVRNGDGVETELVERPVDQPMFTRRLTAEATTFINRHKDGPFLLYLPYSMPHLPLFRSEKFAGRSLRGRYGDAVEEIDWSAGRIRDALERNGIADNTLVIFSSDNGPWQRISTTGAGSAGMLRGSKGTTYEGGMRVPGIFWWPGHIAPGTVSDMGTTLDVYATVLSLAGVERPPASDGMDLGATLRSGAPGPRSELAYYSQGVLTAYRKGRYKLFLANGLSREPLDKVELYDLREDISEQVDIAEARPEIVAELREAIAHHRDRMTVAEPLFDQRLGHPEVGDPEDSGEETP